MPFLVELMLLAMRNANFSTAGSAVLTALSRLLSQIYSDLLIPMAEILKALENQVSNPMPDTLILLLFYFVVALSIVTVTLTELAMSVPLNSRRYSSVS